MYACMYVCMYVTTSGAARSVLLTFEPRNGQPGNSREAWVVLKNKYQNTSRQRRRTLLRWLDNSVVRSDVDPDVFLSEVFQLRGGLNDLGEAVTDERLIFIILDALPEEIYSTVNMQPIRYPELGLDKIMSTTKTIYVLYCLFSVVFRGPAWRLIM